VQALLGRLPQPDAQQVQGIWDALLIARRDCEAMAARGVRVSRDISRDWQETVSDLIDRVVAQDSELAQLRHQVRTGGTNVLVCCSNSSSHARSMPGVCCEHAAPSCGCTRRKRNAAAVVCACSSRPRSRLQLPAAQQAVQARPQPRRQLAPATCLARVPPALLATTSAAWRTCTAR
jgi:hypothetical protein